MADTQIPSLRQSLLRLSFAIIIALSEASYKDKSQTTAPEVNIHTIRLTRGQGGLCYERNKEKNA